MIYRYDGWNAPFRGVVQKHPESKLPMCQEEPFVYITYLFSIGGW